MSEAGDATWHGIIRSSNDCLRSEALWGIFEWLLRDAVQRGWRLGVCANSDEHRGRCGGGVPERLCFGVKGGLTGVLAEKLERGTIATALRARHTFATTGERLVGIAFTDDGHLQGDEIKVSADQELTIKYEFENDGTAASVYRGLGFNRSDSKSERASRGTGVCFARAVKANYRPVGRCTALPTAIVKPSGTEWRCS